MKTPWKTLVEILGETLLETNTGKNTGEISEETLELWEEIFDKFQRKNNDNFNEELWEKSQKEFCERLRIHYDTMQFLIAKQNSLPGH